MCYQCDSWHQTVVYNGVWFCSNKCKEEYIREITKRKQDEVEKLDKEIAELQYRRSKILNELGISEHRYPWK